MRGRAPLWVLAWASVARAAIDGVLSPPLKPCTELLPGQFLCPRPRIDAATQQPEGCGPSNSAPLTCRVLPNLRCRGVTWNNTFASTTPCLYSSGSDWRVALGLSVFLGWAGVDRFYLGYPAIGLFKLCTCGFFFLLHLVDIVLIALQIVGPADGSAYRMDYFGPRVFPRSHMANITWLYPRDEL